MADKIKETVSARSKPAPGEAGRTGDWRSHRPVINRQACSGKDTCLLCWLYCPDGVISREFPLEIDLEYCKGSGVCAEECPRKAITMVDERSSPALGKGLGIDL
jgi:pyruvate ferredoxin oxidoreductase delta subunit